MNQKNIWEKFYENTPLERIPWQKTQADFFNELLKKGNLGNSGTALDLGCGTGKKAIALAKQGFDVIAIDISKTAIKYAKENAKKANAGINFKVADASDLSFLKKKKFDLILDWANLHGIEEKRREKYIKEIIRHSKKSSKLLLRCFSKHQMSKNELGFLTPMGIVYLFSRDDVNVLYGKYFRIVKTHRSKPYKHKYRWLDEYLMERK